MAASNLEIKFIQMWCQVNPDKKYVLHKELVLIPKRKFRADFTHVNSKVVIEIQGQIWKKGGHNTGEGLLRDYEKFNLLTYGGFSCFQLADKMITPEWCKKIREFIDYRLQLKLS